MATEAEISEPIYATKKEGEDRELLSEPFNKRFNELTPEEMKNVESSHVETRTNKPLETTNYMGETENMQVATNIRADTVNDVTKGDVGTVEGEIFLEASSVPKFATEKTSSVPKDYEAVEMPSQAEREMLNNEMLREGKLKDQCVDIVATMNINDQVRNVNEDPNMADKGEDTVNQIINKEHSVTDHSPESTGEETPKFCQEDEMEAEKPRPEVPENTNEVQDTLAPITKETDSEKDCSKESFEEKIVQENAQEVEARKEYNSAQAHTETETQNKEESANANLPSSTVVEKTIEEHTKQEERDVIESKEEVKNSDTEHIGHSFDTTYPTEEIKAEPLKDGAKPNQDTHIRGPTGTSNDTPPKETNEDLDENSSVPDAYKKETEEEILEKPESTVTGVIEATSLKEFNREEKMQSDSSDLASEKSLAPIEPCETQSDEVDINTKHAEASDLSENKNIQLLTSATDGADEAGGKIAHEEQSEHHDTLPKSKDEREISTGDTPQDYISEQNPEESSALSSREHNFMATEVSETTEEIPEKVEASYVNTHSPLPAETTEEKILQIEDESTDPKVHAHMASTDLEKDKANEEVHDEDQQLYTTPLNAETSLTESGDVEHSKEIKASEVADCSAIDKLETSEEEKSTELEKGKLEDEMPVNGTSNEACNTCTDIEKAILEQEYSARNFKSSLKEDVEIEKVVVEVETGGHSHEIEVSEAKSTSTITEEVPETTNEVQDTKAPIIKELDSDKDFSTESFGKKTIQESSQEVEVRDEYKCAGANTETENQNIEESANANLPSKVVEKNIEESLKEKDRDVLESKEEVNNTDTEHTAHSFDTTCPTEEIKAETLKDSAKPNQEPTGTSKDLPLAETNEDPIKNSLVPDVYQKMTEEGILDKAESTVTGVVEETSLNEFNREDQMQSDSSGLASEEGLAPIGPCKTGSDDVHVKAKQAEASNLSENENMQILAAAKDGADEAGEKTGHEAQNTNHDTLPKCQDEREVSTGEMPADSILEQNPKESSALSSKELNLVATDVTETTDETPEKVEASYVNTHSPLPAETTEKVEASYVNTHSPLPAETTEEKILQIEDESTDPKVHVHMSSTDQEKDSANEVHDEDQQLYTNPALNTETSIIESEDVELQKSIKTSEAANCSDADKLETSEDKKSPSTELEKDQLEDEKQVNDASNETCNTCTDTEKAILEQEYSARNFKSSLKEEDEIEKSVVEEEAGSNSHEIEVSESKSTNTITAKVPETTNEVQDTKAPIIKELDSDKDFSTESFKGKTSQESSQEVEVRDEYKFAGANTETENQNIEESANTNLPSKVVEKNIEESLKEEDRDVLESKEEVNNTDTEHTAHSFYTTCPTEEIKAETLKNSAKPNQEPTGTSKDLPLAETNEDPIKNSLVPDVYEKMTEEGILEKAESTVTGVVEETSLNEFNREDQMQSDSSGLASEEGLAPIGPCKTGSDDVNVKAKQAEASNLSENENMQILTAAKDGADEAGEKTGHEAQNTNHDTLPKCQDEREVSAGEMSADSILEQNPKESSALPSKELNLVATEVTETTDKTPEKVEASYVNTHSPLPTETTDEAPEKVEASHVNTHSPLPAETTEEKILQIEDEPTDPKVHVHMSSTDQEKDSANEVYDEDQQLYTNPALNTETSIIESEDVELQKSIKTSEADADKLETSEDEKSPSTELEKDQLEDEKQVNDASNETCNTCTDTKKAILEQEYSARNFKSSLKEDDEREKSVVEVEAGGNSHEIEVSETKSANTISAENAESIEPREQPSCHSESVIEDQSNKTVPETENIKIEEGSNSVKDPKLEPTEEDITGQEFQVGHGEINEEVEPKLEAKNQINKTQDGIETIKDDILAEVSQENCSVPQLSEKTPEEILEKAETIVTGVTEDVELLKGIKTSEAASCSDIDKLETSEEKSLSTELEEQLEDEKPVNDNSNEECNTCTDTEKDIMEQEYSVINFKSSLKEDVEKEKAVVEVEAGGHNEIEVSETKSMSTIAEEKPESIQPREQSGCDSESVINDQSNKVHETNKIQIDEGSNSVKDQNLESIAENITGEDFQVGHRATNEEVEPIIDTEDQINTKLDGIETIKDDILKEVSQENSSEPQVSEKTEEEILEKAETTVTGVREETILKEFEREDKLQLDSTDQVAEGKALVTIGPQETGSDDAEIIAKLAEASDLGENMNSQIPTAANDKADEAGQKTEHELQDDNHNTLQKSEDEREVSTAETTLDYISEPNLKESSTLLSIKHIMKIEASGKIDETPANIEASYVNTHTSIAPETTKEKSLKKQEESTDPRDEAHMASVDIEKDRANENKTQDQTLASTGEEIIAERSKEEEIMVHKILQRTDEGTDDKIEIIEQDDTATDNFAASAGEETKEECSHEKNEDKETNMEVPETTDEVQNTITLIKEETDCDKDCSTESFEGKTIQESSQEDEAREEYKSAGANTETENRNIEDSANTNLPSSTILEKNIEEKLKEEERDIVESKEEVKNSYTEHVGQSFDTTCPTEETKAETLKDGAKPNQECHTQAPTGTSKDIPLVETNEDPVKNSLVPDVYEKVTEEGILEKAESTVTGIIEETSLNEFNREDKMQSDSSGLASEKGLASIGPCETGSDEAHIKAKHAEASNLSEDDMQILTAAKDGADEAGERTAHEASETTADTPEKVEASYVNTHSPLPAETTEEIILQIEDEFIAPKVHAHMASTDPEKDSSKEEDSDEDQELHRTPALNTETSIIKSEDEELPEGIKTSEVANCSDIDKLETPEEEKSPSTDLEKDKFEDEKPVNDDSNEACNTCADTEQVILEKELSAGIFKSSLKKDAEIEKAVVEEEAGGHSHEIEVSETISTGAITEENAESIEPREQPSCESESVNEDQSNKSVPETENIKIEEGSNSVKYSKLESIGEDITRQEFQVGHCEMNEEVDPKLETENQINKTQDGIETIKEDILAEESQENCSVPDVSEKTQEEILEKAEIIVTGVSLKEFEREDKLQLDSTDLAAEEKGLSDDVGIISKLAEASDLGENKNMQIPTAAKDRADEAGEKTEHGEQEDTHNTLQRSEDEREVSTAETPLDYISEQSLKESSTLSSREDNVMATEEGETTDATLENVEASYISRDFSLATVITEEKVLEKQDESTDPRDEAANEEVHDEDQELYKALALNTDITESQDEELQESIKTSEVADSDIGKLETLKHETSLTDELEKEKSEDEKPVNDAFDEAYNTCVDTEKAALEQVNSARSFKSSLKADVEVEKELVEVQTGGHSHEIEVSETKSTSNITEENPESVEPHEQLRCATESADEDESNKTLPETNKIKIEEGSNNVTDLNLESTGKKIIEEDLQEGQREMNEEVEPKLEAENQIKNIHDGIETINDVILTEKVSGEVETTEESENIKEQIVREESCTIALQMTSASNEIVNEITDPDSVPIENLEATHSSENKETVKSQTVEDLSWESEASSITKVPEKDMKNTVENPMNVTSSVFEVSKEITEEENIEETESCNDKTDIAPVTLVTEELGSQKVQLDDKSLRDFDTTSDDKSLATETNQTILQGEEVDSVKLEETSGTVSQLTATEYANVDKESANVEKPHDVEESITSEAVSKSKEKDLEDIHETGKSLHVDRTDKDKLEEEINEVLETISEPNHQGVELVIAGDIISNQTLPSGNLTERLEEPSCVMLSKEEDHEITSKTEKIEEESTRTDETVVTEILEGSFVTNAKEETCLQNEKPRELEVSILEIELIEDKQNDNPDEAPKEESIALEEATSVESQENVYKINFADSPSESEKSVELGKTMDCSSQETSKEDTLASWTSNNETVDLPIPRSTVKEILTVEVSENFEQASTLEFEKSGEVLESLSKEELPKSEETTKEDHIDAATTDSRAEGNQSGKTNDANETIKNKISSKKTTENEIAKDSQVESLDKETIRKNYQEDVLEAVGYPGEKTNQELEPTKNAAQNEELSEELERASEDENIKKQVMIEVRAVEGTYQDSVGDGTVNESLRTEADGKNVGEVPINLSLQKENGETNCRDSKTEATALSEEVNSTEFELVEHDEGSVGAIDKQNISRNEVQYADIGTSQVTDAVSEESPHEEVGEEVDVSEHTCKETIHETIEAHDVNKDIAKEDTNTSKSLKDDEKPYHTPPESAFDGSDVIEDLNLKEQEVSANEARTLSPTGSLQKETGEKVNENTVDEKQRHFISDKQKTDEVIIPEVKCIKDEGERIKDEEPVELSTRERKMKLDEAEIHSIVTANEGGETQDQKAKLNVPSHTNNSGMEISQKDVTADLTKASEIAEDRKKIDKPYLPISDKQILVEPDSNESTKAMISTGNKDAPLEQQDLKAKTFQADIEDLKSGNASEAKPDAKGVECGEQKIIGEESKETTENSTSIESSKISLSNLLQRSTKQSSQVAEHLIEERELTDKNELQADKADTAEVEEAKQDKDEDEEDENKRVDSGSDAPVMVEASRDMDVKVVAHKKSHNILSGVGSKVKHSIAKVKKVITGKSSHPKPSSPK